LLEIEALTNPLARAAAGVLSTIPPERRYLGPHAGVVMTPFVLLGESRFSDGGRYGVLYAASTIETALREVGHHHGRRLRATAAPRGTTLPAFSFTLDVCADLLDIRRANGGASVLYDPDDYSASRQFALRARQDGAVGMLYDSVRCQGGECVGSFWPNAIRKAAPGDRWLLYFDGNEIAEYARVA
jgi:hypothetical protein